MKIKEKEKAVQMRRAGCLIPEIASSLSVSKSTVSEWLRNVQLTDTEEGILASNRYASSLARLKIGTKTQVASRKALRLKYQQEGAEYATKREFEHIVGCMLYWGEGTKSQNLAVFTNSDPVAVLTFKNFVDRYFPGRQYQVRVNCYLNNGLTETEIQQYWLSLLGLSNSSSRKGVFKSTNDEGTFRKNRHRHGICSLYVSGGVSVVQHIYGAIQEYLGINKPEWLGD